MMNFDLFKKYDEKEVLQLFQKFLESDPYIHFHKYRYALILNLLESLVPKIPKSKSLEFLDVGPAYQTLLIHKIFPDFRINSLGFQHEVMDKIKSFDHLNQDLNLGIDAEGSWKERIDIILFAEVLEHLYTNPNQVLKYMHSFLKPSGYMILQTPNGVSLDKRIKMLLGKNPFHLIEDHRQNHFREYTKSELVNYVESTGFEVIYLESKNYFNPDQTLFQRLYLKLNNWMPSSWRDGITIVAQKK